MKRILLSLMVLLMLMPGLACANMMHDQKQAAPMAGMSGDMPCCPKHKPAPDKGTMLMQDCMKVDLQQAADMPLMKKIDTVKHTYPFILTQIANVNLVLVRSHTARGPPPNGPISLSEVHNPVFLLTQRLRI